MKHKTHWTLLVQEPGDQAHALIAINIREANNKVIDLIAIGYSVMLY